MTMFFMKFFRRKSILINSYYEKWSRLNFINFILVSKLLHYLLSIPIIALVSISGVEDDTIGGPDLNKLSFIESLIFIAVAAPIFETYLGQHLPIKITQKFVKNHSNKIPILVSTLLFSAFHATYSFWYFLIILPLGWILATAYTIFQSRKESAFWITAAIHMLQNLIAVLMRYEDFSNL